MKIIASMYPKVKTINRICGTNSKKKSSGFLKYNAFNPFIKTPKINNEKLRKSLLIKKLTNPMTFE